MRVAEKGHDEIVKRLIRAGADVNAKNVEGNTALMLALDYYHVIDTLIAAGADTSLTNNVGFTALKLAGIKGKRVACEHLMRAVHRPQPQAPPPAPAPAAAPDDEDADE